MGNFITVCEIDIEKLKEESKRFRTVTEFAEWLELPRHKLHYVMKTGRCSEGTAEKLEAKIPGIIKERHFVVSKRR